MPSQGNSKPFIYMLPSEIVCSIFLHLKDSNTPSPSSTPSIIGRECNTNQFQWVIDISHVSRFFRGISINCPGLWTDIPSYSVELADLFLKRSGSISRPELTWLVNADIYGSAPADLAKLSNLIGKHLQRIRIMQLHAPWSILTQIFPILKPNTPAPGLQELCIIDTSGPDLRLFPTNNFDPELDHEPVSNHILPATLDSCAYNIQFLELSGIQIQLGTMKRITNLRRLKMKFEDEANITPVVELLSQNPHLEELVLLGITHMPVVENPVDLPSLRDLVLEGGMVECANLVCNLLTPVSTNITWRSTIPDLLVASMTLGLIIRPILSSSNLRKGCTSIEQLSLSHRIPKGGELYFRLRPQNCHLCPLRCMHGSVVVHFVFPNRSNDVVFIMWKFCRMLPFTSINSLSLSSGPLKPEIAKASPDPNGTLSVVGNPSQELLRVVLTPALIARKEDRLRLPSIQTVSVEHTDLEYQESSMEDYREFVFGAFAEVFMYILHNTALKSHVREVKLTNCYSVSSSTISRLKDLVETVTWDGLDLPGSSPELVEDWEDSDFIVTSGSGERYDW